MEADETESQTHLIYKWMPWRLKLKNVLKKMFLITVDKENVSLYYFAIGTCLILLPPSGEVTAGLEVARVKQYQYTTTK